MKIRPTTDWILVKVDPLETHVGSILIPDNAVGQENRKATVVSAGPGDTHMDGTLVPPGVVPGERVVFNRAHGEHLIGKSMRVALAELEGEHLFLKPEDILFVMEEEVSVS